MGMIRKKLGFTLIEVIVVIGVIALTLPAVFTVMFVVLQQQVKIIRLTEVKRQGDAVLTRFQTDVQNNATGIYDRQPGLPGAQQYCFGSNPLMPPSGNQTLFFSGRLSNVWYRFTLDPVHGRIQYTSSGIDNFLTTNKLWVDPSTFTISCVLNQEFTAPVVSIAFDICYKNDPQSTSCAAGRAEEIANLHYSANIRLRNQ